MWELDVDGRSWEANPGFSKQMLQENAWHIIQRAKNKRICMATSQYSRQTPGAFTANRRKTSWFGHVCRHDTLPNIILQGTVDGRRRRDRWRKSWKDNINEWTDSRCHHCCTSRMTEADGQSPQQRNLLEYLQQCLGVMGVSQWVSTEKWQVKLFTPYDNGTINPFYWAADAIA